MTLLLDRIALFIVRIIRARARTRRFANVFVPINDSIGIDVIARGDYEATPLDALVDVALNKKDGELCFDRSGMFIDVGANIGLYTLALSEIFNRVIALEANPVTYKVLEANCALNGLGNVRCLCSGASADRRAASLFMPRSGGLGWSALTNKWRDAGGAIEQTVQLDTLDNLAETHGFAEALVSLIKIDVEGHELAVLQGARGLLQRGSPILMIEINSARMAADIFDFLEAIDYTRYYQCQRGLAFRHRGSGSVLDAVRRGAPARMTPTSRQTFRAAPGQLILAARDAERAATPD